MKCTREDFPGTQRREGNGANVKIAESLAFLHALHRQVNARQDGHVAFVFKGVITKTVYAPVNAVPEEVASWPGHVWVSVCTFGHRRAQEAARAVPALWVDLDPPKDLTGSALDEWQHIAHERLMSFALRPSLVVFSGRGWHGYWLFRKPVWLAADGADRQHLAALIVRTNQTLAARLGGDAVGDLARVMRLPGTVNPRTGTICRLVSSDGPLYDLDVVVKALAPAGRREPSREQGARSASCSVPRDIRVNKPLVRRRHPGRPPRGVTVRDLRTLPAWARVLVTSGVWRAGRRYRTPGGFDRSRADMAVVGAMVRADWPDVRIRAVFRRRDWLIGVRYRELIHRDGIQRANDYLDRSITKARCGPISPCAAPL